MTTVYYGETEGIADDVLRAWGNNNDIVGVLRSTVLAADTALPNVLVGTVVGEALAANSFIGSNVTASGDYALYWNRGGNSEQFLFGDASAGVLYLTPYFGGLLLALAVDPPAPDGAAVHIWNGSAGVVVADVNGNVIIESSATQNYLSFLQPDNGLGGVQVGNPASSGHGQMIYGGPTAGVPSTWRIFTVATERLRISAAAFAFQEATTISTTAGALTLAPAGALNLQNAITDTLGFFGITAIDQEVAIANASGGVTIDAEARTALNALLASMRLYGLIAA